MTVYRVDSVVSPKASFRLNGAPFDPTTITLTISKPRTTAPVVKAKSDHYNDSPGDYVLDLTLDQRGTWRLRWLGTGTYVDSQGRTRPFVQSIPMTLQVYA